MKGGFTIIEMLIVITIILILTTFTYTAFYQSNERHLLTGDVGAIVESINSARGKTLSREDNSLYGINIGTSTVTIFRGSTFSSSNSTNEQVYLSGKTTISKSLTGGDSIIFNQLDGTTQNVGTITITTKRSALSKTITVYGTGVVTQ